MEEERRENLPREGKEENIRPAGYFTSEKWEERIEIFHFSKR